MINNTVLKRNCSKKNQHTEYIFVDKIGNKIVKVICKQNSNRHELVGALVFDKSKIIVHRVRGRLGECFKQIIYRISYC